MFSYHKSHSIRDGGQNTKKKTAIDHNQRVYQPTLDEKISMSKKLSLPLNHDEQVCRTEIYQPIHVASTQGDSKSFKLLFPNCPIAQD